MEKIPQEKAKTYALTLFQQKGMKLGHPVLMKGKEICWKSWILTGWMHWEKAEKRSFLVNQSNGQKFRLPSIENVEWWEMDGV